MDISDRTVANVVFLIGSAACLRQASTHPDRWMLSKGLRFSFRRQQLSSVKYVNTGSSDTLIPIPHLYFGDDCLRRIFPRERPISLDGGEMEGR